MSINKGFMPLIFKKNSLQRDYNLAWLIKSVKNQLLL